jgi:hypothetical protein
MHAAYQNIYKKKIFQIMPESEDWISWSREPLELAGPPAHACSIPKYSRLCQNLRTGSVGAESH